MTAPSDPEAAPEGREEEQQIVLRLSDILPRVPAHLLKPGPHDTDTQLRFSVDELAEKISRGRVSVPLERLFVCPDVFRDSSAFLGQQEIPLPLQKLLEQVGLSKTPATPTPASNGIPPDQVAQARAEANRIIEANAGEPVPEFAPAPSVHSIRIAKAISTARQILGLFGKPQESARLAAEEEKQDHVNSHSPEPLSGRPAGEQTSESPPVVQSTVSSPAVPEQTPDQPAAPAKPAPESVPDGNISLRVLPIFRLLPTALLRSSAPPAEDVRINLPLSEIDPQLAGGHVEVALESFINALPENLRQNIVPASGAQVWIPLDEIFQNLPPDHLFYMPPLESGPEGEPAELPGFENGSSSHRKPAPLPEGRTEEAPGPQRQTSAAGETSRAAGSPSAAETQDLKSGPEGAAAPLKPGTLVEAGGELPAASEAGQSPSSENINKEPAAVNEPSESQALLSAGDAVVPAAQATPADIAPPAPEPENDAAQEPAEEQTASAATKASDLSASGKDDAAPAQEKAPAVEEAPSTENAAPLKDKPAPEATPSRGDAAPAPQKAAPLPTSPEPPAIQRAPWMRGFQVPPPGFSPAVIAIP